MPKTLEGVSSGPLKKTTTVPQPGEGRKAADIETPVKDLLNNDLFLNALIEALTRRITEHGHDLATETKAGFMSPGDRQNIRDFMAALASHAHATVTVDAPGFASKEDKIKLNGIEAKAHTVTRARAETALGIMRGEFTLPESAFSAGQVKPYTINVEGVKYDAPIAVSETLKGESFLMTYHAEGNSISVRIRNLASVSKTFPGGTVRYMVFNGP